MTSIIIKNILTVQCGLYDDINSIIIDISNNIILKPHPTAKMITDWYNLPDNQNFGNLYLHRIKVIVQKFVNENPFSESDDPEFDYINDY